ncbi:flagellar biosynthesis protein FliQ [Candidatus Poribacteria bacterium]|nr:flagellar biosynthesis protein FliQ [Candidatus Poribacteria bacterium]
MTEEFVVYIIRQGLITILTAAAPVLIIGLAVGLIVSILQAISQVHEMTLTFIPKIVAIFAALIIFGSWMVRVITNFATGILANLAEYAQM